MNFKIYFNNAYNISEYENLLDDKLLNNKLSLHNLHFKNFNLYQNDITKIAKLSSINILVITEPWCGDSIALLPVIKKIAETNPSWNLKIVLRDENVDLMEKFLTNGNKAIPIFLFLDNKFEYLFKWGPRPVAAQNIFEQYREKINNGEIEKSKVILKIRQFYAKDKGRSISKEVLELIYSHIK